MSVLSCSCPLPSRIVVHRHDHGHAAPVSHGCNSSISQLSSQRSSTFPCAFRIANPILRGGSISNPSVFSVNSTTYIESDDEYDPCGLAQNWEEDEENNIWEGALIYRRSSSQSHIEYVTSLERLGLGKISSNASQSKASSIGLGPTSLANGVPSGTPVQISMDITRKKKRLRLDGIIKTVISLPCISCSGLAGHSIFLNFALLLMEEPVEESDDVSRPGRSKGSDHTRDQDSDVDSDDRLYFPHDQTEIDISKNIRDLIHLEIRLDAVCDPLCKGFCFGCYTNLNKAACTCEQ